MNIAIIGAGNVGSTLAMAFRKAGHSVIFGVKDPTIDFKGKELADTLGFPYFITNNAVEKSDVIVLCTPAKNADNVAKSLGNVQGKIIIDTMNGLGMQPTGFTNTTDAILANCNTTDAVKCFNSTGFENMSNPLYAENRIDMFVAGDSQKGKQIAQQLAKDIGFENCYDFGGNDKFFALEQFAFAWINLAIMQKQGRNIAFKILKR
jgi:hypothetical protein